MMELTFWSYACLSWILVIGSFLPRFKNKSWPFRIFDFIRLQSLLFLFISFVFGAFLTYQNPVLIGFTQCAILVSIVYQVRIILPYLPIQKKRPSLPLRPNSIKVISVNVYQFNRRYSDLVQLVQTEQPDILVTMESDLNWEKGMAELESDFVYAKKIPLDNTYGMHFYTKLKVKSVSTHFFIANDRPCISAILLDDEGHEFQFWAVHPPPPSPTEEPTSKQKDGELMRVAKSICETDLPAVVVGDFNSVCWSASSKLFAKTAHLKDARRGLGIKGTFPAKPWALRFPIDLMFYSPGVMVNELETLKDIGSDHLPLSSTFTIYADDLANTGIDESLEPRVEAIIQEGKMAHKMESRS